MKFIGILLLLTSTLSFAANVSTSRYIKFHRQLITCEERFPYDEDKVLECIGMERLARKTAQVQNLTDEPKAP